MSLSRTRADLRDVDRGFSSGGSESNADAKYSTNLPHPVAEVCCVCSCNEVRLGGGGAGSRRFAPDVFSRRQVPSEGLRPAVDMKTFLSSLTTINY